MPPLSQEIIMILSNFAVLFTQPSFAHAHCLLTGALLCRGARRISSILRVMGLSQEKRFEKYHRFLNRAQWNSLMASRILLGLLIQCLPDSYPILMPIDETIERRSGKKITAKGCYRDACRSTESQVVTCFGLKWICLTLIVPLPWTSRPWALPVMTVLAPSKSANEQRGRSHRTSIDWTIVMIRMISRWLKRHWVLIGDGGFACIRLGLVCNNKNVTLISRLRLDAALYEFPAAPKTGQLGRRREKGIRAPSLQQLANDKEQSWSTCEIAWYSGERKILQLLTGINLWYSAGEKPLPIRWVITIDPSTSRIEAFFSTQLELEPKKIISWFVLRWNIEVTFEEVRAHLGVETQRQWSDRAIKRTTPLLMGLFSMVNLFAKEMVKTQSLPILSTAWYNKKSEATFSDILTFVRRPIWAGRYFNDSAVAPNFIKIERTQWENLLNQLAGAT